MSDDSLQANAETVEVDSASGDFTDEADEDSVQPTVSDFACEYCGKRVKTKPGLHKHKKRFHDAERRQLMKFLCSKGCKTGFPHLNLLRNHYVAKHDQPPHQITAQFPSVEAFEAWKESEEQTANAKFVVKDRRSAGQKGRTRVMYWCHRSGKAGETKDTPRAKTPRNAAKCGVICTAAINIFINPNGTVNMTYFPEHWGHDRDAEYLFVTKEQRQEIAQQIIDGLSPEEIVKHCQNSDNIRLKKVTRSTIYRICRDFKIEWIWSKQDVKMAGGNSPSARVFAEEETSRSEDDLDNVGLDEMETLVPSQKQALECLNRISTLIVNGAMLTSDDMSHLETLKNKLNGQFTNLEVPSDCVMILDTAQTSSRSPSNTSRHAPRDLNVAIINYDG
ncbi:uncharacterized protein LOC100902287 [Galendromus occidentalis]|uniref:Uncharacterized protein LOC100902287 n=1 Tax=Galendromus occidentalis TaxID=34638 RepID=A0AAJ6W0N8_9ACAR|nr:uncharacterized protein LOC100902287 [Galendromus occidentalis]